MEILFINTKCLLTQESSNEFRTKKNFFDNWPVENFIAGSKYLEKNFIKKVKFIT